MLVKERFCEGRVSGCESHQEGKHSSRKGSIQVGEICSLESRVNQELTSPDSGLQTPDCKFPPLECFPS